MKTKKLIAGICAATLVCTLTFPLTASAIEYDELLEKENITSAEDVVSWLKAFSEMDMTGVGSTVYLNEYTVPDYKVPAKAPAQRKFDLRDVNGENYITPIKDQHPYGSCWAHALVAASEGSIAYELGTDRMSSDGTLSPLLDLSERHLAWFSYQSIGDNTAASNQKGEGQYIDKEQQLAKNGIKTGREYNSSVFNMGGFGLFSLPTFSNLIGPVLETDVPYHNDESTAKEGSYQLVEFVKDPREIGDLIPLDGLMTLTDYITDESFVKHYYHSEEEYQQVLDSTLGKMNESNFKWYKGEGVYLLASPLSPSTDGTWLVDNNEQFSHAAEVEHINLLPFFGYEALSNSPVYTFQVDTLNAVKNELVNGRPVGVSYLERGDKATLQNTFGTFTTFRDENGELVNEDDQAKYICHYTYCPYYDPKDPETLNYTMKDYGTHMVTIVGYDDDFPKDYFYDPNGTISGNGAYIVKNSWGTDWGDDGYFYISYYDQSLGGAVTFDYKVDSVQDKKVDTKLQSYDFQPTLFFNEIKAVVKASMANVFEADSNMYLRTVGYTTITNNEELEYEVYLLDQNAKDPTDGKLAATVHSSCAFSGYHTADLEKPVFLKKGQRYSIVVTVKREDGNYGIALHPQINEEGTKLSYQAQLDSIKEAEDLSDRMKEQYINLLNDNLSYFHAVVNTGESYLMAGDEWTDLAEIYQALHADPYGYYKDIDNFSIKAVSDAEIITVTAKPETAEKQLKAGDTVTIRFTVSNQTENSQNNVVLEIDEKDTLAIGNVDKLDSVEKKYTYTLTEEDVKNNRAELPVHAYLDQASGKKELMLFDETSSTKVTLDLTPHTSKTTAPAETTEPATTEMTEQNQPSETTGTTDTTQPSETTTTTQNTTTTESATTTVTTEEPKPVATTVQNESTPTETIVTTETKNFTNDQLEAYARKDYEAKNGITPSNASANTNADGSVSVALYDASGNILDTYRVDPATGKGTDQNGNDVDLPQTGNNSPAAAAGAGLAVLMFAAGCFTFLKGGIFRKKEQ